MNCPFCGFEFNENDASKTCKGCPLARSCSLVRCPNCGYEFPPEPKTLGAIKNMWRWVYEKIRTKE